MENEKRKPGRPRTGRAMVLKNLRVGREQYARWLAASEREEFKSWSAWVRLVLDDRARKGPSGFGR